MSSAVYLYIYELCSFSNPSVTSPTSQLILQPFRRFTYVTAHSPTLQLLHLRHSSFSNPFSASPTSQYLHLIHLTSRPCDRQCAKYVSGIKLQRWNRTKNRAVASFDAALIIFFQTPSKYSFFLSSSVIYLLPM